MLPAYRHTYHVEIRLINRLPIVLTGSKLKEQFRKPVRGFDGQIKEATTAVAMAMRSRTQFGL